jgi:hypothetical protein
MRPEIKTKRRWISSILEAVAEPLPGRQFGQVEEKPMYRRAAGTKGFALRLKAATRPVARAAR